jgi:hypothetical protein
MIYSILTSFLFLLSYTLANEKIERRQIYYIVLFTLFFFSALRYQVGCDWDPYYIIFRNSIDLDWTYIIEGNREPLFWIIPIFLNKMNLPFPFLNIICSVIFFTGIHILARRQPDPLAFLVLLFPILIIGMAMSGIRQGSAIGIICIALVSFIDRRPINFSFWVLVATGFHSSAVLFLLILPFATGRFNNTRFGMALLLSLPALILISLLESAHWALNTYVGTGREAYGAIFRVSFLGLSAFYFFFFIKNKWKKNSPEDYSIVSLGAMGMVMTLFLILISSIIGDRIGYYLIPIQAMIFARLPYLPFRFNHSFHSALPYLLTFFIFITWTQTSWIFQTCYLPYENFIFGKTWGDYLIDPSNANAILY